MATPDPGLGVLIGGWPKTLDLRAVRRVLVAVVRRRSEPSPVPGNRPRLDGASGDQATSTGRDTAAPPARRTVGLRIHALRGSGALGKTWIPESDIQMGRLRAQG